MRIREKWSQIKTSTENFRLVGARLKPNFCRMDIYCVRTLKDPDPVICRNNRNTKENARYIHSFKSIRP